MERDTGVAPVTSPWQGDELLLHQTRNKQQAQLTVQNMLLLQQGILNHCYWTTERISKPYLQLWSQNQDLNLNLQNSVLR